MIRFCRIFVYIIAFTLISSSVSALTINHDKLFKAYLVNDMNVWGTELSSYVKSQNMTHQEKFEVCNYLYGYVAAILDDADKNTVKYWLDIFDGYLNDLEKAGKYTAEVHVYRSSVYAYKAKKFSSQMLSAASKCFKELDAAFTADENCAIAHGLKGNMEFFLPAIMGGSKKNSIKYFSKAVELMPKNQPILYRWNWCATQLCLAQAYEKTNQKDKAIAVCNETLKRYPDFVYMRDTYLPSLKKK
ncbi:MAG: tetratricopeptide repeat protein [Bacteroidales bacterium]|nr:tetratricopeptide repeat protein [Bacteroidales bacterium]MDD5975322.1 tetratricopeptide repeat protein [Bacteroidales bacterium]MDY5194655.1 tetratricopeptide repeat protein [Candidatus Aphodosoma sp.]